MRNLAFVSLVLLIALITSCSSIKSGCGNQETVQLTRQDIISVIEPTDSLQKFDIEITFMGKSLNGMLLVKLQNKDTVRVVINSYFGMSIMDFEFTSNSFASHYILEGMNKPAVINLFKNDFKLLLGLNLPEQFTASRSVCKHSEQLITVKTDEGKYLYKTNPSNLSFEIKAPGTSVKSVSESGSKTITLKHSGIFTPNITIQKNLSE